MTEELRADLVLEGGGVKGIALAGAIEELAEAGYAFPRVAGTSAGAITASVVAAMQRAGSSLDRLHEIALTADYSRFRDRGGISRWLAPLPPLADAVGLLLASGIYKGDHLLDWVRGTLADQGVATFDDLRLPPDPDSDLPEAHRYRAVVVTSDVSRRREARLPWDYGIYGRQAGEMSVAEAVRMSASIPYFFRPMKLRAVDGAVSTIVDGGLLSNYPITIFDRTDGLPPRWPTIGIRLSARQPPTTHRVDGPVSLGIALVDSVYGAWDSMRIDDPCTTRRSIFIDTADVSTTDFDIDRATQRDLFDRGRRAAKTFLTTWDFEAYVEGCRGGPQ